MKLIATDLDGTLFNSKGTISEENLKSIEKAQENGVNVVVSTGRVFKSASKILNELNINVPYMITSNGAEIRKKTGETLYSMPLQKDVVNECMIRLKNADFFFNIATDEGFIEEETAVDTLFRDLDKLRLHNPGADEKPFFDFYDYVYSGKEGEHTKYTFEELLNYDKPIYSIIVISFNEYRLAEGRELLKDIKGITKDSSAFNNFEIVNENASKGKALTYLCNHLDISPKDIMAIGDNFNDLSMLKVAKHSVAMGNAKDEIKKQCSFVTKTNDEHGFAYAVEHFYALHSDGSLARK